MPKGKDGQIAAVNALRGTDAAYFNGEHKGHGPGGSAFQ